MVVRLHPIPSVASVAGVHSILLDTSNFPIQKPVSSYSPKVNAG